MNELKPIRQLPELENHQEWVCEAGCDHIEPKLHRNIYQQSWDPQGKLISEMAEHYYTCQDGHLLAVMDSKKFDYVTLPDEAYQVRENVYGFSLDQIHQLRKMLDEAKAQYCGDNLGELSKYFKYASVSIDVIFKGKDTLTITYEYLDELEAGISDEDAELNAIADNRKGQKRVSVNIEDL